MMGKIKKGLVALVTSTVLASGAAAAKSRVPKNYASVGGAASVSKIDKFSFTMGIDGARKINLVDELGIMFGYSLQLPFKKDILNEMVLKGKLDITIDNVFKNSEIYVGPGFWMQNKIPYFAPNIGLRTHFGKAKGFYISTEGGMLMRDDATGGYLEAGFGFRWGH